MKKLTYYLTILTFSLFITNSFAFSPEEHLPEDQEKRARNLFLQVKCLVCEGQVIESSDTQISYELRKLIRNKILKGESDKEIKFYLIDRYGEDIITSPGFNNNTLLLWLLPAVFAFSGIIFLILRRSGQ